tara:strand:+ start:12017 stop:12496 length:480 start_codon:yes stop_codon:yes gene_type:complete
MKNLLFLILLIYSSMSIADVRECIKIDDDSARLDCFDEYFSQNTDIRLITEELTSNGEIKENKFDEEYEKRNFGLSNKQRIEPEAEEIKIISKIESVSQRLNLQLLIILENGQIWQSVEKIRDIKLRDGYEVEIKEGFFSGYTLRVPGKKIKLRVRRKK